LKSFFLYSNFDNFDPVFIVSYFSSTVKKIFLPLLFTFVYFTCTAQNIKDLFIEDSDNGKPIAELLMEIEKKAGVDFIYNEKKMQALTVYGVTNKQRLLDYLNNYLSTYKIVRVTEKIIFIMDKNQADAHGLSKENYIVLKEKAGSTYSLEGVVLDGKTDEALVGAQVIFPSTKKGTLSDVNGNF
jgi:hypothetical protein